MSDNNDNLPDLAPGVSSLYRAVAREQAPEDINQAVMDRARREASTNRIVAWRDTWYRPAAFVAIAGLSLALVLQMTSMDVAEIPDATSGVAPATRNLFQEAGQATQDQVLQLETEASRSTTLPPNMTTPDSVTTGTLTGVGDVGPNLPTDGYCNGEQRAETTTWWLCIENLEKQGRTQAAERELQALLQTFPEFTGPE